MKFAGTDIDKGAYFSKKTRMPLNSLGSSTKNKVNKKWLNVIFLMQNARELWNLQWV